MSYEPQDDPEFTAPGGLRRYLAAVVKGDSGREPDAYDKLATYLKWNPDSLLEDSELSKKAFFTLARHHKSEITHPLMHEGELIIKRIMIPLAMLTSAMTGFMATAAPLGATASGGGSHWRNSITPKSRFTMDAS